jgi:peptidoglycan/xylan/chitin deacetylase (PgdA/CDA1 family)
MHTIPSTVHIANKPFKVLSAGKRFAWPEGNVIAVCPIVAWETWPEHLGTDKSHQRTNRGPLPPNSRWHRDEWVIQDHDYAEIEGIWNLLDMFDRVGVKATFVSSGASIERFPEIAKECERRGHEMASENYIHEYPVVYSLEEERQDLQKNIAAFQSVLGHHPRGYISPGHRPSDNTVELVTELGYVWDADFMLADEPAVLDVHGKPLVTMPYAHISDYHAYDFKTYPRALQDMLTDEFDHLYALGVAGKPKMIGYAFHPFLSHGFRVKPIEEFFKYTQRFSGVWFPTRIQIANWMLENYR